MVFVPGEPGHGRGQPVHRLAVGVLPAADLGFQRGQFLTRGVHEQPAPVVGEQPLPPVAIGPGQQQQPDRP